MKHKNLSASILCLVLGVVGFLAYEKIDAGSSIQSLSTDSNGRITAHERDGSSQTVITGTGNQTINGDLNVTGTTEISQRTDGDCGNGNQCSGNNTGVSFGNYTGTGSCTAVSNTGTGHRWKRDGDVVTFSGKVLMDCNINTGFMEFDATFTLPFTLSGCSGWWSGTRFANNNANGNVDDPVSPPSKVVRFKGYVVSAFINDGFYHFTCTTG